MVEEVEEEEVVVVGVVIKTRSPFPPLSALSSASLAPSTSSKVLRWKAD